MSEATDTTAVVEVPAPRAGAAHAAGSNVINYDPWLVGLTWLAFGVMAFILYKVAWKPILKALDNRENSIRRALEDAEKARADMAQMEARGKELLAKADAEAQAVLAAARVSARDLATAMETRAREEAAAIVTAARQEIRTATDQARAELRQETAELVTTLAGRLVRENMDDAKNRALVARLAAEG